MGSITYLLSLSLTPRDECTISQKRNWTGLAKLERERERERELTQQFPEIWVEDNTPGLAKQQVPVVLELKPSTITSAPALGLPDLDKPFTVYVTEKDKVAMGVLSQTMGTWDRSVAYPSNQLDNVAAGWLGWWAVAVVALLVWEATKLTLGQDLIVKVLHEVNTLQRGDPHKWLSTSQITQYQRLLCENLYGTIEPCHTLNLATILLGGRWALT